MFILVSVIAIALMFSRTNAGATLNDTETLFNDVLTGYNKYIRPVEDQEETMNVSVLMHIKTLIELDEVQGTLSFTGALFFSWQDMRIRWDPTQYGGANIMKFRTSHVWVPDMILLNVAQDMDTVSKSWQVVDFIHDGHSVWNPGGLFKSACDIDIRYYPFDIQTCEMLFISWGYTTDDVRILEMGNTVDTSLYTSHPRWELIKTSAQSWNFTGTIPGIMFKFHLKRKPAFVIVSVMMPILFLSLLNVLAFVLVPESGERVSYCISVLLSVAVFMTIVSNTLPNSSEPLPLIAYKLMFDLIITFMTILNLNIYHKSEKDEVPECMQAFYICFTNCRFTSSSNAIQKSPVNSSTASNVIKPFGSIHTEMPTVSKDVRNQGTASLDPLADVVVAEHQNDTHLEDLRQINKTSEDHLCEHLPDRDFNQVPPVTWRQISRMLDCVFLITFTMASVASFVSFLLMSI